MKKSWERKKAEYSVRMISTTCTRIWVLDVTNPWKSYVQDSVVSVNVKHVVRCFNWWEWVIWLLNGILIRIWKINALSNCEFDYGVWSSSDRPQPQLHIIPKKFTIWPRYFAHVTLLFFIWGLPCASLFLIIVVFRMSNF